MQAINDLAFVQRVVEELEADDIVTWVFGGWAEELLGLAPPRSHHDVDLLCPARDFEQVDTFIANGTYDEIAAKRLAHKRAFEVDGVMVELFLVHGTEGSYYTEFWGTTRYDWPADVLGPRLDDVRVASARAVAGYRAHRTRG